MRDDENTIEKEQTEKYCEYQKMLSAQMNDAEAKSKQVMKQMNLLYHVSLFLVVSMRTIIVTKTF